MAYIPRLIFVVILEAVEALQPHHRPQVPAMLDALVTLATFFKSVECLSSVPPTLQPTKVNPHSLDPRPFPPFSIRARSRTLNPPPPPPPPWSHQWMQLAKQYTELLGSKPSEILTFAGQRPKLFKPNEYQALMAAVSDQDTKQRNLHNLQNILAASLSSNASPPPPPTRTRPK